MTSIDPPSDSVQSLSPLWLTLIRLISNRQAVSLSAQEWKRLFDLAQRQRIASSLYAVLKEQGVDLPPEIRAIFKAEQRRIAQSNLRLYANLHHLATLFKMAEIPFILLKGSHLAKAIYPSIALRVIGDIDLLLPYEHQEQAVRLLLANGYHTPSGQQFEVQSAAIVDRHLPLLVKDGSPPIEIHWHVAKRETPNYDVKELWQRARTIMIDDISYLTLAPEDLLIHLCVHASYQHQFAFDLRSLWDIRAVCNVHPELNWEGIFERAQRWQVKRGVFATLHLAAEIVNAPVPLSVLHRASLGAVQDQILSAARQQLLTLDSGQIGVNRQMARLYATPGFFKRIQILYERLLPSRALIAREYSVSASSIWVYAYYPLRIFHVLRKHSTSFWRVQTKDPTLMPNIERAALLWTWLMEEGEEP